ncbi:hypothetical protein BCR42DRAFT_196590 [Absidia repens]|uniref:Uncharacterized protein n=1 Tax=Absidia repens TaxID=90262 RepID=A0A1X2IUK2_9FUNG|nr:hypothetical protein BCR42DRAFT_196590 [Absidia repens]
MSAPPSPPNGIVSANIKLFNNKTSNDNSDNPSSSSSSRLPPPITPRTTSSPRIAPTRPARPDIPPTPTKQSLSSLTTSTRNVENIRRHATGDNSNDYYLHQIQHQKVFPHATGNGMLQRTHNSSNESFFTSTSSIRPPPQQQQNNLLVSPPPPPPRPNAPGVLSSLETKPGSSTNLTNGGAMTFTKKEDDNKTTALNANVFKGVFGKVVGSVSGK